MLIKTLFLIFLFPSFAQSQTNDKLLELSQKINDVRSRLNILQSEISQKKDELKNEIGAKIIARSELEAEVVSLTETKAKLADDTAKMSISHEQKINGLQELAPLITKTCRRLEIEIKNQIPFQTTKRLKALNDICNDETSKNSMPSTNRIQKLWAFLEDEIRLGNEVSVSTGEVSFNDKKYLVEQVKIGTLALYAKTPEDIYLVADKNTKQFRKAAVEEEKAIRNLIVGLKRDIRTGPYELPVLFDAATLQTGDTAQ